MSITKIIVVTMVKDEAWMLERFLATCSQFADHIIVSDESSSLDNSLEIYSRYPKVILHHNSGDSVRGDLRRQFVFQEARKIVCDKRIIIPIDSDEIISGNLFESPEWTTVLNAEPGTLVHLQWVILWKNYLYYWSQNSNYYGNFNRHIWIDDGFSEIPSVGYQEMHMAYNPLTALKHIYLNDIVCLHFVACNWHRMESKHRYYRAHEKMNIKKLSNLAIYRIYGHLTSKKIKYRRSPSKWFDAWINSGIDMTSVEMQELTHYDLSVIEMFMKKGTNFFAMQDIWRVDWDMLVKLAKSLKKIPEEYQFIGPKRSLWIRIFHVYMRVTIDIKFLRYLESKIFGKSFLYEKI
jgi:hypothetical protein